MLFIENISSSIEVVNNYHNYMKTYNIPFLVRGVNYSNDYSCRLVAASWYKFSLEMLNILSIAVGKINNPRKKCFPAETLFEELGEGREKSIHCDLFLEVCNKLCIADKDRSSLLEVSNNSFLIDDLVLKVKSLDDENEILGLLYGLEIPANENIESLISGVSSSDQMYSVIEQLRFFKIHRVVEDIHIERGAFSYFLCSHIGALDSFNKGIQISLEFWKEFWGNLGK